MLLPVHWSLNLITYLVTLNGLGFYPNRFGVSMFSYYKTFVRGAITGLVLFLIPFSRY